MKIGKKTAQWNRVRAKLKVKFLQMGITSCELRLEGCWGSNGLGFAHSLKRRHITSEEELEEVILACNVCHDKIEMLGEDKMCEIVLEVIKQREEGLSKWIRI